MAEAKRICSIPGCEKSVRTRGWCGMHYARLMSNGDTGPVGSLLASNQGTLCSGPECDREATRKGMCGAHYRQARRGDPLRPIRENFGATRGMTLDERLQYYTGDPNENGCRIWSGSINDRGYAVINTRGARKSALAHRVAHDLAKGEVTPAHLPIHHKCGVTACVEVTHLQVVEPWENSAEMHERRHYIRRIGELEEALFALDPNHPLLKKAEKPARDATAKEAS